MRYLLLLLLFTSCVMESKKDDIPASSPEKFTRENEFNQKISAINGGISEYKVGNSLAYINNDQSTEEVFAYLDEKGGIVKLEEKFFDASTQNRGTRFFYLENGKKIASQELIIDQKSHNGLFVDRISYYDKGKVVYTKERTAEYEDQIQSVEYHKATLYDCSIKTAQMVLNQEGPFKTTFQGFYKNGPLDYLIVGGPGEKDYTSTMLVQFVDQQVEFLQKNERRMIGTPLVVNYEKMIDQQNFEFQVLLKVQIVTE